MQTCLSALVTGGTSKPVDRLRQFSPHTGFLLEQIEEENQRRNKLIQLPQVICYTKYANDTCVRVPAVNIQLLEVWATANNLTLNRAKCKEIVFSENRRGGGAQLVIPHHSQTSSDFIEGARCDRDKPSVTQWTCQDIMGRCAQTIHAPDVRSHGMTVENLATDGL